jgi:hypothetical protein
MALLRDLMGGPIRERLDQLQVRPNPEMLSA